MKTLIWAHRGSSIAAPENTLPAFRLAVEQGADGVELDVRTTADGELVVIHDNNLKRLCGQDMKVSESKFEDLRKLNVNLKLPEYGFVCMPTLAEVYELLYPTGLTVNVELKTDGSSDMSLKLLDLAKQYKMEDRVLYSSFDHNSLLALRKHDSSVKIGLLYNNTIARAWDYGHMLGADALHPCRIGFFDSDETLAGCEKFGIDINLWTVDAPETMKCCFDAGLHAVITDLPDVARQVRDGK